MYKIIFSAKAKGELNQAIDWYEDKQNGLGKRFATEVKNKQSVIKKQPDRYPIKQNKLREAQVSKFPYHIIYDVNEKAKTITITSIFHSKRNPADKYK